MTRLLLRLPPRCPLPAGPVQSLFPDSTFQLFFLSPATNLARLHQRLKFPKAVGLPVSSLLETFPWLLSEHPHPISCTTPNLCADFLLCQFYSSLPVLFTAFLRCTHGALASLSALIVFAHMTSSTRRVPPCHDHVALSLLVRFSTKGLLF